MGQLKSLLYLVILSFGFVIIKYFITFLFTLIVSSKFSSGVSFIGFPIESFYIIAISIIFELAVLFPICLFFCIKVYYKISDKLTLGKLSKFTVIFISGIIIFSSSAFAQYFFSYAIGQYNFKKANKDFNVSVSIADEEIIGKIKNYPKLNGYFPVEEKYYKYTYAVDNQTAITYNVKIEVAPGFDGKNYLFDYPADGLSLGYKEIKPGKNYITGEYHLTRAWTHSLYPVNGKVPISVSFYNSGIHLGKTVYIFSTLLSWKKEFEN